MSSANYVVRRENGALLTSSANQSPGEFAEGLDGASYQLDWSGFDALNAKAEIECSNDRTGWNLLSNDPSTVCNFTEASGTQVINIKKDSLKNAYLRVQYTPNSNTTGTLTFKFLGW